jgi:succinate dehydrogenase / fumarate reductase cytochrome b subunit
MTSYFSSTIGRKTLMGLTGLGLCLFILMHMLGNLLIFVSPEAYNKYSHSLISNPLIYVAEIGLVLFFGLHTLMAFYLTFFNQRSKGSRYAVKPARDRDTSLAAKTLIYSGFLILTFLILHLITFKYGPHYPVTYNNVEMRDLYKLVQEVFAQPGYVIWYVIAMLFLALHLSHSISASFQTLGLFSSSDCTLKKISWGFATVVCAGFISQAVITYAQSLNAVR